MKRTLLLAGLVLTFAQIQFADDNSNPASTTGQPQTNAQPSSDTAPANNTAVQASDEGLLSRWLTLNTLSLSLRYRSTDDANGSKLFQFGQQRSLVDGKFKLDSDGKYTINFHVSSGRYFNWAYADVIGGSFAGRAGGSITRFPLPLLIAAGEAEATDPLFPTIMNYTESRGWEMAVRQLYFSASPIKQVTFEYGGLGIERGVNTEMTTYDDDGYMAGERIRIKDPEHLFFDQMAVTYGYLGDIFFPSFFDRGDRLAQSNYHQFLLEKKLSGRLDMSVDWTEHLGTHTMREAALLNTRESHVLDSVRLELYQRTNAINLGGETFAGGNGFGVTAAKNLTKQWHIEGGYADIDQNYAVYTGSRFLTVVGHSINGDAYAMGDRFFGRAMYKPCPYFSLFGYYTHDFDTNFMTLNRETVYGGAELNLKEILNSSFHLF